MICRICENQFLPLQSDISIMAPIVYRETSSSHTCACAVQGGKGLEWLIQRTDTEQRKKGPNEWVEEVLNGIRGTCIVFWRHQDDLLLLSRCIRSVLQLYFVFLSIFPAFVFCTLETQWLAHLLSESSDSNYHHLSPNNPTIKENTTEQDLLFI